ACRELADRPGVGSMTLAAVRSDVASVAFPFLVGAAGFLLLRHSGRTRPRFPNTDLERGLDRLFAQDDRALLAETVQVLRAERTSAGADLTLPNDPVAMLAYGLRARRAEADLTSL